MWETTIWMYWVTFSLVAFPYSCEWNEIIHLLFCFQPKLCGTGIRLPVTEIFVQATAKCTQIFLILSAVSGLKKSFIFSGRWYSIIFLSFPVRLVHSGAELSLPPAFFSQTSKETSQDLLLWMNLFRCACLLIRFSILSSISQSLTSVIKLAVNTYQLFLKGGEVHQQLYDPIQCPEGVPYSSHNHSLIFWTCLSILVNTLKVALNWNN